MFNQKYIDMKYIETIDQALEIVKGIKELEILKAELKEWPTEYIDEYTGIEFQLFAEIERAFHFWSSGEIGISSIKDSIKHYKDMKDITYPHSRALLSKVRRYNYLNDMVKNPEYIKDEIIRVINIALNN